MTPTIAPSVVAFVLTKAGENTASILRGCLVEVGIGPGTR
jgi:hypothetical protein